MTSLELQLLNSLRAIAAQYDSVLNDIAYRATVDHIARAALVVHECAVDKYPTGGMFNRAPLPWKYDCHTRNIIAADGSVVARNGDSVYGDPAIGEGIVKIVNSLTIKTA